ncbi:GntR family transcriptional regulator [Streptomyces sp900105245]|uniref:GntR family transcriptional regulator n=1 Tax=Streptomyces sp. 900105245 TaxID=3154379 RepID=A0ABV1UK57_9ACTN
MTSRRPTLVEQVRSGLRELIDTGTYKPGDQLPNEQEMGNRFGVSRATLREAYRGLSEAGYLVQRQGSGTFVARSPNQHALDLNLSYTEMIRSAGFTPSIVVLKSYTQQANDDDVARLGLPPDEDVLVVERLRLADDRPVVFSIDKLRAALVSPHVRGSDDFGQSLFGLLEQLSCGARNGRACIKPVLASGAAARHLQVAEGSPLLFFDETDFDASGRAVLASSEWHTSDVFDMWINRQATPHSRRI